MRFGPLSLLVAALAGHGIPLVSAAPHTENAAASAANGAVTSKILDLTAKDFKETIAKDHWIVRFYLPSCPACTRSAPFWRAVGGYYNTPDSSGSSVADSYKFRFANMNCQAYGDMCTELEIAQTPTYIVYKDGKVEEKTAGAQGIEKLTQITEKWLATIKPGSRPEQLPVISVSETEESKAAAEEHDHAVEEPKKETKKEATTTAIAIARATQKAYVEGVINPQGISEVLDAEKFQAKVLNSRDGWFVKFYAPWCGHCQAMAPAWEELGKEMEGKLNVGEVNCDANKRLCKDVGVKGYPTIIYFQNGQKVNYDGLRGLGDLVTYARRAVNSSIKDIDAAGLAELEKSEDSEVAFIYFYDHATSSEDFEALNRLTLNLIGHAPLYKTNDPELYTRFRVYNKPKLMVLRDSRPAYYNAIAPHEFRDYNRVLDWMRRVWLPIVPELTAANSHEIMNNRYVVLGVLNRDQKERFDVAKKELKEAAVEFMDQRQQEEILERKELRDKKQLRLDEAQDRNDERGVKAAKKMRVEVSNRKDVGFAWVDGVFWERWIRSTYGVNVHEDGERIIINDEDNKRYWDTSIDGRSISPSRSQILESLKDVLASPPRIPYKSTGSRLEGAYITARNGLNDHPVFWMLVLIGFIVGGAFWGRKRMAGKGGFFKLDGKEGLGLLGGNGHGGSQGKVD